jgi:LPS export ABC transporter protein LptC
MNKIFSILNVFFYTAAFVLSCFFIYGCENSDSVVQEWTTDKQMVEVATKVESYMSQDGRVKAKLVAPLMNRVFADTVYVEFPQSLHVDFFNDSTQIESWLDSRYGKYYETQNKVYLRDSVVVISKKGDTLRCQDLWWDQNRGLFYTDNIATYHSPGNNITGYKGMEATQDFSNVTFKHPLGNVKIAANGFAE